MYMYTHDGRLIENASILAASPGNGGMAFMIDGTLNTPDGGTPFQAWIHQVDIRVIRFDRATMFDQAEEPGPDDFKIGTRYTEIDAVSRHNADREAGVD